MSASARRRLRAVVVPILIAGLVVALYFIVFGTRPPSADAAAADSFSRSALGHHALVAFLEASGTPVLRSRHGSATKARSGVPLLLIEPPSGGELERFELTARTASARGVPLVVVLPKWSGAARADRPGWLERVSLLPAAQPGRTLTRLIAATSTAAAPGEDERADVERGAADDTAPSADGAAIGPRSPIHRPGRSASWSGAWAGKIAIERPQLIAGGLLEPLVAAEEGVLAGWLPERRVLVIADPDLLNNAGIGRAGHAAVVEQLLIASLDAHAFVLDEVLHGHGENVRRALLRLPFVGLTLHAALLALLVLWRAVGRFGRPLPAPPRLAPGKGALIDNTARLLAAGRRGRGAVRRYLEATLRRGSRRAGLAPAASTEEQARALGRLAQARGVRRDIVALAAACLDRSGAHGTLALARDLHAWYRETFDAAHRAPHHR